MSILTELFLIIKLIFLGIKIRFYPTFPNISRFLSSIELVAKENPKIFFSYINSALDDIQKEAYKKYEVEDIVDTVVNNPHFYTFISKHPNSETLLGMVEVIDKLVYIQSLCKESLGNEE
jgi:hypothetical protein